MFKLKLSFKFIAEYGALPVSCAFLFFSLPSWAQNYNAIEFDPQVEIRTPAGVRYSSEVTKGRVQAFKDHKQIEVLSYSSEWTVGETVVVTSQLGNLGVIAFLEVQRIDNNQDGSYQITAALLRQSRNAFVQVGDNVEQLDLSSENRKYNGTTDLLVKKSSKDISAKYKPLFTQGISIGETAETLWEDEYLVNWYGYLAYGVSEKTSVSAILPAYLLGAINGTIKHKFFESTSNIFATGLNFARIPNENRSTLNFNLYWDSVSSESVLSHTYLSIALFSFSDAKESVAIKSLGTSSFQTGYEFILNDWDRVLVGPSYNFVAKTIGGYMGYIFIWDTFHLSTTVNATDISEFRYSPENGYYFLLDAYWRF